MRPILWHIGSIPIYSFGFFLAITFVIGAILAIRHSKAQGISEDTIIDLALVSCLSAIIGARIAFVLLELPYYRLHPGEILRLGEGGLSFHGGLIGGVGVGIVFCLRRGISPWKMVDIVAPIIALGTGIARIGCFLNGCCYGNLTNLPWGIACALGDPRPRHPTQIYESVLDIALFFFLYRRREHNRFPGYLGLLYIIYYSLLRSFVEIFRDSRYLFGPIKIAQAFSFLLIILAAGAIYFLNGRHRKKSSY